LILPAASAVLEVLLRARVADRVCLIVDVETDRVLVVLAGRTRFALETPAAFRRRFEE
jgi:hypothetical protein